MVEVSAGSAADVRLAPAIAETIRNLPDSPVDAGVVRLVEKYAAAVDEAALIAQELAEVEPDGESQSRLLHSLQRRVEAQAVLADLGPKLLAALAELGATPKSRRSAKGGAADDGGAQSVLDELRERRARQNGAAAVDSASS